MALTNKLNRKKVTIMFIGALFITAFIALNSPILFVFNPKYGAAKRRMLDLGKRLQVDSHTLFYEPFIAELSKEFLITRPVWHHKELNLTREYNEWNFMMDLHYDYDFIEFNIEGDEVGLVKRIDACYGCYKLFPLVDPCETIYQRQ